MNNRMYIMLIVGFVSGAYLSADDKGAFQSDAQTSDESSQTLQSSDIQSEAAGAQQSGTKVSMKDLPQAVQKTIQTHSKGFNVENIQQKTMQGQSVYTASYDKDNMRTHLTVGQDGSLLQFTQTSDVAIGVAVPEIGGTKIQLSQLPGPVRQAIKQRAGQQEVGNITKQEGKAIYHAAFNEGGIHTDLFVSEEGKIIAETQQTALFVAPLESAQKVSVNTAPQPVQQTIRQQAGASKVSDIDKGTWKGQTAYKVMVEKNGNPVPLIISESGQLLGDTISEAAGAEPQGQQQQEQLEDTQQQPEQQTPQN